MGVVGAIQEGIAVGVGVPLFIAPLPVALHVLLSGKGQDIFSAEYREILARTPGMKPRLSARSWKKAGLATLATALGLFILIRWT